MNKTLRSKQRTNVLAAHRGRGHDKGSILLAYSVKMDQDIILPSERQLIHWIHFLETNADVKAFNLVPDPVRGHDGERERDTELDAIVTYCDHRVEWHEVKDKDPGSTSQTRAQCDAATRAGVERILITDAGLKPHTQTSMRWLKAICYAAAIRGREHHPTRRELFSYFRKNRRGSLQDVLVSLSNHDEAVVTGMAVRLAIEGAITIDLARSSLRYDSVLELRETGS